MANFKSKNLCDESSKIKILRWQFSCIFRWLRRGILRFFCRRRFHGENPRSKSPVLKNFKKVKKRVFSYGKIRPLEMIFLLFFPPIFLVCPRGTFWTPELWSETQNEGFQQRLPSDHIWSFLIILPSVLRDYQNSAPHIIRIQPLPANCILTRKQVVSKLKNIFIWNFLHILNIYTVLNNCYSWNYLQRQKITCKTLVKKT